MNLGSFGNIIFEPLVSPGTVSREIRTVWAEQEVAGGKNRLQPTGEAADKISLSIRLRQAYGDYRVDVKAQIKALSEMARAHEAHALFIGSESMGAYVIDALRIEYVDLVNADIDLTLIEYN